MEVGEEEVQHLSRRLPPPLAGQLQVLAPLVLHLPLVVEPEVSS